ncbi:hypothetical protein AB1Y20_015831 [Prymnesium parvum]|uniref:Uncharacterized protein n=1 Tax=Prymnesium parvum TaxID=97485 RepID=A0AB34JZN4_PRYPA
MGKLRLVLICLTAAAILVQLAPVLWPQRLVAPLTPTASAYTAPPPECDLFCTPGGAAEPTATDLSLPPLLPLPHDAVLLVYHTRGDGWLDCAVGGGAILQLPRHSPRLVRSSAAPAAFALPDEAWLRVPYPSTAAAAARADAVRPSCAAGGSTPADVASLLSLPHARCIVPAGSLVLSAAWAEARPLPLSPLSSSPLSPPPLSPPPLNATPPADAAADRAHTDPAPSAHADACARRDEPPAGLHELRLAAAASTRGQWTFSSHAPRAKASRPPRARAALLVRIPPRLPDGRLRAALAALSAQLRPAEEGEAAAVSVLLLGSRPLCDESPLALAFVRRHPSAAHLWLARPAAATPAAPPHLFSHELMRVWSLVVASPYRMVASAASPLPAGAVDARLEALRALAPRCDAVFLSPPAFPDAAAPLSTPAAPLLRAWQLFDRTPTLALRADGSIARRTPLGEPPLPWLDAAPVLAARLPRGALPAWRHATVASLCPSSPPSSPSSPSSSPSSSSSTTTTTSSSSSSSSSSSFSSSPSSSSPSSLPEEAADDGEATFDALRFWLGCLQAGLTLCTPSAAASDPAPPPVRGAMLRRLLDGARLSRLRVLLVAELPSPRVLQLISQLAAEGHAVSVVVAAAAAVAGETLADAGWRELCAACALRRAAECAACGEALERRPHRVAVVGDEALRRAHQFDLLLAVGALGGCAAPAAAQRLGRARGLPPPRLVVVDDDFLEAGGNASRHCPRGEAAAPSDEAADDAPLAASLTLALCDEDRHLLARQFPQRRIRALPLVPSAVPPESCRPDGLPALASAAESGDSSGCWSTTSDVLFVGGFSRANVLALRWLLRGVWPQLRRGVPRLKLHLVGAPQWGDEAAAAAFTEGIAVYDSIDNNEHLLRSARVVVSPRLVSSGTHSAAILALEKGIPIVTTPQGARGLRASRTEGMLSIGKTASEFAAHTLRLLQNVSAWTEQRSRARMHVVRHLGLGLLQHELRRAIFEVMR